MITRFVNHGTQMIARFLWKLAAFRHRLAIRREMKGIATRWQKYRQGKITADEAVVGLDVVTDPKCRVKGCHGRGFTGWYENGEPIPCKCAQVVKRTTA